MAGTQIQGLDALLTTQVRMNEAQGNAKNGTGKEFEDLMAQAAGVLEAARMAGGQNPQNQAFTAQTPDTDITRIAAPRSQNPVRDTADRPKTQEENKQTISQDDNNKDNARVTDDNAQKGKDLREAADDAGRKIVSEVAEKLEIPEEDVEAAMEILGISAMELLDPVNLTALLTELTGESDPMVLVTDAELYETYKDLMQFAKETGMEAGVAPEDVKLLANPEAETENVEFAVDPAKEKPFIVGQEAAKEEAPVTVQMSKTDSEGNEVAVQVTMEKGSVVAEQVNQSGTEHESQGRGGRQGRGENQNAQHAQHVEMADQMVNEIAGRMTQEQVNFNEVLPTEQTAGTDMQQMVDIVRQITEQIRVSINADVTSMELTLHPASLGNVQLTVAQDAQGRMVAQFVVESETVRQAIESQLSSLQQRLDEQGVRIEAVEVSVETRGFEAGANGQQTGEQADRQREEQMRASGPRTTRRIDLTDFDPEEAEDEETRITAEMMAANGQTVDYTA